MKNLKKLPIENKNVEEIVSFLKQNVRNEYLFWFIYNEKFFCSEESSINQFCREVEYIDKERKYINLLEEKFPLWLQEGEKLIYVERYADWEECIISTSTNIYLGEEIIDTALSIMKALSKQKSFKFATNILDESTLLEQSKEIVKLIVLRFSKRGPWFYAKINEDVITSEELKYAAHIALENKEFEKNLLTSKLVLSTEK